MASAGTRQDTRRAAAFAFPVLIGDIGGTNARFALIADRDAAPEVFHPVATADFPDIESAVREGVFAYSELRPKTALIDLAGPIVGDAVDLTNAHWVVRPKDMIERLGLEDVVLLNDFEALALSLTSLDDDARVAIGEASEGRGAKVVVGPGTGLGVGALVDAGGIWVPVPGEGGHVALGPAEADEFPLWANIEPEHGRISAEALLCGRGLVRLYRAVAKTDARQATLGGPAEITKAGLAGSDPAAARTLALYCRLLGRLAGDMALTFMARGGVYIGGGISPRILPVLLEGEFRRAFEAKAPHEALMAEIPTWVIVAENPALQGLATFARSPELFGVNLSGRRWLA
jgi:glucokinase